MNCKTCGESMIPAYCRNCERGKRAESGAKLRAQRVAAGMSLRALAKLLDVSHVYLGEVERGDRAGYKLREAIKAELAKAKKGQAK